MVSQKMIAMPGGMKIQKLVTALSRERSSWLISGLLAIFLPRAFAAPP